MRPHVCGAECMNVCMYVGWMDGWMGGWMVGSSVSVRPLGCFFQTDDRISIDFGPHTRCTGGETVKGSIYVEIPFGMPVLSVFGTGWHFC